MAGDRAPTSAEEVIQRFETDYQKGKPVTVLTHKHGVTSCIATLVEGLSALSIRGCGTATIACHIVLEEVNKISLGAEGAEDAKLPLNDNCVTIFLDSGLCLAFSFPNVEKRDTFGLCISRLVDSLRNEEESSEDEPGQYPDQARVVVKKFVRSYVKGQVLDVLKVGGGVSECLVTLDKAITTLSLQLARSRSGSRREIPLEDLREISLGTGAQQDVEGLALDDRCVTLLQADGQGVAFRFADVERRDAFARCLRLFVEGRRTEVARKRARKSYHRR